MLRPLAVYSLLRLSLFAIAYVVLALLVGLSAPIALVLALVASALGSLTLLRPQRDEVAQAIVRRRTERAEARERRRAALDDPPPA